MHVETGSFVGSHSLSQSLAFLEVGGCVCENTCSENPLFQKGSKQRGQEEKVRVAVEFGKRDVACAVARSVGVALGNRGRRNYSSWGSPSQPKVKREAGP